MIYKLGDRINIILMKQGIELSELADKLHISYKHLTQILRNESQSTIYFLKDISEILNVPTDVILQDIDKKFIIYAIDDYLSMIDHKVINDNINDLLTLTNQPLEEKVNE